MSNTFETIMTQFVATLARARLVPEVVEVWDEFQRGHVELKRRVQLHEITREEEIDRLHAQLHDYLRERAGKIPIVAEFSSRLAMVAVSETLTAALGGGTTTSIEMALREDDLDGQFGAGAP